MDSSASPLYDRLVFLVGAQRSGTNWLQRLLAAHPDVVALPGETQLFATGIEVLRQRVQHGVLTSPATATVFMDRSAFVVAARAFCDTAFGGVAERLRPGARRIVERSPNHVEHLEVIGSVYPDAWVVHIVRDGRDVARSLVSQPWGPRSVAEAASLWARSIRSAHEAAVHLARYREVRYEDLLGDPVEGLAELFRFLELNVDAEALDAVLAEAGVAFNTDRRRPQIGDGKWRAEWTGRDLAAFERVAGDVRASLGYPEAAATGTRTRQLVRAAKRAASSRAGRAATPHPPDRPYMPMGERQRRVDAVCAALALADASAVAKLLTEDCEVRVVSASGDARARAVAGTVLLEALADDGPWGEQVRGDVHLSPSTWTVVLSHRSRSVRQDRVVVIRFGRDDLVSSLTVYGFPL